MTVALMEWETIGRDQILDIMAGRPPKPPVDFVPRTDGPDVKPPDGGGAVVTAPVEPTAA